MTSSSRPASRLAHLFAIVLCCHIGIVLADSGFDQLAADGSNSEEAQDVLLLGPLEPTRLRLRIEVDGVPFRRTWREALNRLFELIDTDHDGKLTLEQANRMAAIFGAAPVSSATINQSDSKKMSMQEGTLTRNDIFGQFEKSAPPVKLVQKLSNQGAGPALVPLLDTDGDGRLSREELTNAAQSLHCRDFNDDQLITDQELIAGPTLSDGSSQGEPSAIEGSVVLLSNTMDASTVAEILLGRYDRNRDGTISLEAPAEVQCLAGSLSQLDLDGDHILTRTELRGYLDRPVDVDLPFALGGGKTKLKSVAGARYRLREKKLINGYRLQVGSMEINFGYKKSDPNSDDTRPRMRDFDADKSDHLDATEFANVPDRPEFTVVDTNGDEKISADEFDTYFQQKLKAAAVQILLDVTEQGADLFRTFDQNGDRVLTPRELLSAPKLLETEDQDHDGYLGGAEMSYSLDLVLTRGAPRNPLNGNVTARRVALPRVKADRTGPAWFLKMDRNRDGDVGPAEFPGSRQVFCKLDLNGDGLLSADEATAISISIK